MIIIFLQGFLVESKLMKLLAPLDKDEQSLMKLDAIFNVSLIFHPFFQILNSTSVFFSYSQDDMKIHKLGTSSLYCRRFQYCGRFLLLWRDTFSTVEG